MCYFSELHVLHVSCVSFCLLLKVSCIGRGGIGKKLEGLGGGVAKGWVGDCVGERTGWVGSGRERIGMFLTFKKIIAGCM